MSEKGMNIMHHIIIGNSAAAIGAVEGIRKIDKESRITIISDEPYHTYSRPLISYYLAGKVDEDKMIYRELDFYRRNNVETRLGCKVIWVDCYNNEVVLESQERIRYDRLLIAAGGKPFIPPTEGLGKREIYTFLKLDDVKAIKNVCTPGARTVIIGAGLIGLKAAEALRKLQVEVTVVELANRVLSAILDETAADIVQKRLEEHQVSFRLNTTVSSFNGDERVNSVTLNDGSVIECDFVIIAIGVVPNTDMLKDTPLNVNRGIVVDSHMRTNFENIFAAGDVCESYDTLYNVQRVTPILPGAYKQGEAAGQNMAGGEAEYEGGFAMNSIGFFDLPMITAGIGRPEGEGFEILEKRNVQSGSYKKVVLKDNRVVGFIYLNEIDRAGIMTNLIKEKIDVDQFKYEILKNDFGYINFPKDYRKQKMLGQKAVST